MLFLVVLTKVVHPLERLRFSDAMCYTQEISRSQGDTIIMLPACDPGSTIRIRATVLQPQDIQFVGLW
jgi:hypothetical protein